MKQMTQKEMASKGGKTRAKKYSKKQLSAWAKKGGRPRKNPPVDNLLASNKEIV